LDHLVGEREQRQWHFDAERVRGVEVEIEQSCRIFRPDMGINTRGTFMVSKYCIAHLTKAENPHILMLSPPLDMKAKWSISRARDRSLFHGGKRSLAGSGGVCTENPIRVYRMIESAKLAR
jgi:hypothetical protein